MNRCERCGRELACGEDGRTTLLRRISARSHSEHSRRLCDRCLQAVAAVMTEQLPGARPYGDDDPLGGADVLTEGAPE